MEHCNSLYSNHLTAADQAGHIPCLLLPETPKSANDEMRTAYGVFGCLTLVPLIAACAGGGAPDQRPGDASIFWDWGRPSAEELERARMEMTWRRVVEVDTAALEEERSPNLETWDDISVETIRNWMMHLPLHDDVAGPSVLRVQILLDRALFTPGIIDGHWGTNTEKAVYWFQHREGLPATGQITEATFERLLLLAGQPDYLVVEHRLSAEDAEGPFVTIPDDIYEHAELQCSCYESLQEKLGERFHSSPELLSKLNPGVDLNTVAAGTTIYVPNIREPTAGQNLVISRLVISDEGRYLHALDGNDRILFHFPATLGSAYDPSPTGTFRVTSIVEDPWWHYQPQILEHVDDDEEDARIPPGPNNAVGVIWMALSEPHYGIHGTNAPETIGYASSAGCVRLTNWDALFLGRRIRENTPVAFRDT
jgi:lipoprotein-anchoring transpeptidase ErfK/SrfK